jgi:transcriptional regulator with XRE-family HTH domain
VVGVEPHNVALEHHAERGEVLVGRLEDAALPVGDGLRLAESERGRELRLRLATLDTRNADVPREPPGSNGSSCLLTSHVATTVHSVAASNNPPRVVPFRNSGTVTTLAEMAKAHAKRIGARGAERRKELGLTQKQVAARMVDSPSTDTQQVSNWERGVHKPSDDNLELWAEALETTLADLYAGPLSEREEEGGPTPDVFGALANGKPPADEIRAQLDRIEAAQQEILAKLAPLAETVSRDLEPSVRRLEAWRKDVDAGQAAPGTQRKGPQARNRRRRDAG